MNKKLCMLVMNEVSSDPRVTKEARVVGDKCQLTVVGERHSLEKSVHEIADNYQIYRVDSIKNNNGPTSIIQKVIKKIAGIVKITIAASKQKADVYHAHDFEMLPGAFVAAKLRKAKLVYDSHELWIEQRPDFPPLFKKVVMIIEGFLIKRVDEVITVNESIALELQKRYKLAKKPTILHNFTNKTLVDEPKVPKLDSEKVVVLYHGGYMKDRGLEELIKSFEYVSGNVVLHLRGFGPIEEELRNIAKDLIKAGKVVFCPPVSMRELVTAAQSADIGIIPYKPTCLNNLYSFPNKLSEYLMAGLAVCASDIPEIARLNQQVHFGALFDPFNPESIAAAINELASDKVQLLACRENALKWSLSEGNWEEESKKLDDLYNRLLV
ncbi:glycosyltransferase family 4 protein [Schinkia azotoformans]|uniref:glycosyltransferase family 4 protein n=1 Tax=Schinkia azotoformans TaxID=1454 RepID=UPI002DBB51CB|nr:glycosyltransferase family 4 protein [Schinkia azotoformans]MEC1714820.1 glycosyltransferase family 4 protein [Schinkia azotoformans]MEC1741726.1 glycosyltransferase family 4 protein [Schinkia azotoformans]MEC1766596.1 glycosyltransferase family 4 protein [Schinkia azotoformans]MEC1788011.1 glycosyltransferase family 4 protein [Schinkia azotoformans]MED4375423.1 glycosyltransferase family 4 protein [Schinkia azotoformans]